mmetsp:Transcript_19541/g.32591  ORF Transcript_19541/g.32591 Transcript_19541/m.32591 type:complete len:394 (+) Transcript_19541:132-1313(+)|eukprot:CAMPEP_0184655496 /NCGR_PEP_ID=MMETSP0308-20130426/13099_1 /TAXON_ID=38269 /ORGANISM="Gloeochaete witrockiana, Strain SAG 46.84" /LENGTH=393 /DNA_ID=CAMNT_0027091987 /DNA_START=144 /DNA_END=1325 /DNA_ORIENTATION=-
MKERRIRRRPESAKGFPSASQESSEKMQTKLLRRVFLVLISLVGLFLLLRGRHPPDVQQKPASGPVEDVSEPHANLDPVTPPSSQQMMMYEGENRFGKVRVEKHPAGNGLFDLQLWTNALEESRIRCRQVSDDHCEIDHNYLCHAYYLSLMGALPVFDLLYKHRGVASASPLFSEPSKTLMLGMGGGVLPCFFLHYFPKMSVSVVDINEKIFEGAKAGMMCPTDDVAHRFHAIVADGVEFVRDAKEKYDIIIMDVSCGVSWSDIKFGLEPCVPPLAFTKKEVLASIAKMTKGIFIMHIWDDPETYVIETRQILRGLFKGGGFLHFRSEGSHIQIYWKDDLGPFLPQEVLEQSPITIKTAGLEKIWRSGTASIQEWINSNIAADMYWHGKKRGA